MISIIVCTRSSELLQRLVQNVTETIGVPHEIIAIDNSTGKYGICEAYNIGARQSQYDALCFMHEDLRFHTEGWGQLVLNTLANLEIGVVGVAGGTYQSKAPTSWISNTIPCLRTNVLHSTGRPFLRVDYWNPQQEVLAEVATVDGLWMCCRKEIWEKFPFDQESFPHFHFYDIDFCTKVFSKYKIVVTYEILIEHFSEGTFKVDWAINALKYYRIRNAYLPFGKTDLSDGEARYVEFTIFQQTLKTLINYKADAKHIAYCAYCCLRLNPRNTDTLWIVKQYLKGKTFYKQEHLG